MASLIQNVAIIIFIILLTLPGPRPPPSPSQTSDSRELLSSFAGAELVQTSKRKKTVFFAETEQRQKNCIILLKLNSCKHLKRQHTVLFAETELVQTFQRPKPVFFAKT